MEQKQDGTGQGERLQGSGGAPTVDITDFLLARIAEDEAVAQAAAADKNDRRMDISFPDPAGHSWTADQGMVSGEGKWNTLWDCEGAESLCTAPAVAEHMARHNPARILAECAANRAIVDTHDQRGQRWEGFPRADKQVAYCVEDQLAAPCTTIRHLAGIYSDHPDYQQEWAA